MHDAPVHDEKAVPARVGDSAGVLANARLTGVAGAVLLVLLALDGATILRIHALIAAHVFLGMLVIPVVLLKTITTGYRFLHYYRGDPDYVRKGPPALILRVLGPFVVALTFAVLLTGIAAAIKGPGTAWLGLHKAAFILWFGAMTVHVLGHVADTGRLLVGDLDTRSRVPGAAQRLMLVSAALLAGLVLAVATRGWADSWHQLARF